MKFKYVIKLVKILVNIYKSGVAVQKVIEMKGEKTISSATQNVL